MSWKRFQHQERLCSILGESLYRDHESLLCEQCGQAYQVTHFCKHVPVHPLLPTVFSFSQDPKETSLHIGYISDICLLVKKDQNINGLNRVMIQVSHLLKKQCQRGCHKWDWPTQLNHPAYYIGWRYQHYVAKRKMRFNFLVDKTVVYLWAFQCDLKDS